MHMNIHKRPFCSQLIAIVNLNNMCMWFYMELDQINYASIILEQCFGKMLQKSLTYQIMIVVKKQTKINSIDITAHE